MRYAIITNPVSGKMTVDEKRSALAKPAEILGAEIHGLDTVKAEELSQCARELATRCDVLVTAGGDGTLSDIINSIDTARTPIAFLPLGTGNAMQHALKYKGGLANIAIRIRDGNIHEYDLVNCDEKRRAFTVSVGIEGTVIRLRDQYLSQGAIGFNAYFRAVFNSYFKEYKRTFARITVDDITFEVNNLLSLMVVKQPYYGFGMNVVPGARFDDGQLHILCINSGLFMSAMAVATSFTLGNRIGQYRTARQVTVNSGRPLVLQIDGNDAWEADAFLFTVLPNALKIKC
ncbi:MAG: NAD(+)/NADH kinase [Deltaproteobacteria bacterium]|nr:NAD(+)/NADH kinase [Deltaproteobacteria bacterium]